MAKARFKGTCQCGADFAAGASVRWDRTNGKLVAVECPSCQPGTHGSEHAPSAPLELRLKIQKVRFSKPDGSWTVAEARFDGTPPADSPVDSGDGFSVVGPLGKKLHSGGPDRGLR